MAKNRKLKARFAASFDSSSQTRSGCQFSTSTSLPAVPDNAIFVASPVNPSSPMPITADDFCLPDSRSTIAADDFNPRSPMPITADAISVPNQMSNLAAELSSASPSTAPILGISLVFDSSPISKLVQPIGYGVCTDDFNINGSSHPDELNGDYVSVLVGSGSPKSGDRTLERNCKSQVDAVGDDVSRQHFVAVATSSLTESRNDITTATFVDKSGYKFGDDCVNAVNILVVVKPAWSSLFKSLPRIVGAYSPQKFSTQVIDWINVLPPEVIKEAVSHWSAHLVGFFLDVSSSYSIVREQCKHAWKLKDSSNAGFRLEES